MYMSNKINIGEVYRSNHYGDFTVLKYNSSRDVIIKFNQTEYTTTVRADSILAGEVKDYYLPSVYGVGYLGVGKYSKKTHKSYYNVWCEMLRRCYSKEFHITNPTYKGCSVTTEWHNFQSFALWCDSAYIQGYQLDKDIKIEGNKVYSPKTCSFVTAQVNSSKAHSSTFVLRNPDGVVHTGVNVRAFCRDNSLDPSAINKVLNDKASHHKGWTKV